MPHPDTCPPYSDPAPFRARVEGLDLTVYPDGQDRLRALIDLIDAAQTRLRLCFYIFARDETGRRVRDALVRAAGRGVAATLIVDSFGADADAGFFREFRDLGGDFRVFSARRTMRYLIRNHQKMALVDEGKAMVGGFNIADDYFAPPARNGWNDLGFVIEGAAVDPLHEWFDHLEDWTDSDGVEWRQLRHAVRDWDAARGACRWLMGGPSRRRSSWARWVAGDLESGRRLDLVMAYFSPPNGLLRRVERIGRRGHARVMTAGISDNNATIGASRSLYAGMLRKRVDVYEFHACKMHTKLLIVDDVVYLGSANFDFRSIYINLEIMLRIEDAAFARAMRDYVDHLATGSRRITTRRLRRMNTLGNRIRWNIGWLLVSVIDYTVSRRLNLGL